MKLKTLKEIPYVLIGIMDASHPKASKYLKERCISMEDLKQEAIKWIKGIDRDTQGNFCLLCMDFDCKDDNHIQDGWLNEHSCGDDNAFEISAVIRWIKHFFNITEEDLK